LRAILVFQTLRESLPMQAFRSLHNGLEHIQLSNLNYTKPKTETKKNLSKKKKKKFFLVGGLDGLDAQIQTQHDHGRDDEPHAPRNQQPLDPQTARCARGHGRGGGRARVARRGYRTSGDGASRERRVGRGRRGHDGEDARRHGVGGVVSSGSFNDRGGSGPVFRVFGRVWLAGVAGRGVGRRGLAGVVTTVVRSVVRSRRLAAQVGGVGRVVRRRWLAVLAVVGMSVVGRRWLA